MKANFSKDFIELMILENGEDWYQNGLENVAGDKGGLTKWGVSSPTWASWQQQQGEDASPLSDMTLDEAMQIARQWYWDAVSCDQLPTGLDFAMFQFAYVSGPGTATKKLQQVLGVTEDGAIGDETLGALQEADTQDVISKLLGDQVQYDDLIAQGDPSQQQFVAGWTQRVQDTMDFISSYKGAFGVVFFCSPASACC